MKKRFVLALAAVVALLAAGCVMPPAPPDPGPELCPPGFFSATGETPCTPAPAGKFVDSEGATAATDCPPGFYQDEEGQVSCKVALPGTFVDVSGAASATLCPLGRFQPSAAAIDCLLAPLGTYVDVTGAVVAADCPLGTTTEFKGSTSLSNCLAMFAVAYIDVDADKVFSHNGSDVLVAKLVDSNGDEVVSIGDTIMQNQYPTNITTGLPAGTFDTAIRTVDAVTFTESSPGYPKSGAILVESNSEEYLFYAVHSGDDLESYRSPCIDLQDKYYDPVDGGEDVIIATGCGSPDVFILPPDSDPDGYVDGDWLASDIFLDDGA